MGLFCGALTAEPGAGMALTGKMAGVYRRKKYPEYQKSFGNLTICRQKFLPEQGSGRQPAFFETAELVVTGTIIFDNRWEIAQRIGIPAAELQEMPGAELAGRAYLKLGADCATLFDGIFAIVLYDMAHSRLLFVCDQTGSATVYYAFCGNDLYFASTQKQLLALGGALTAVDAGKITRLIKEKGVYYVPENEWADTLRLNIKRVPAGCYWSCAPDNPAASRKQVRYYNLESNIRRLHLSGDREYEEAYRQCLNAAVRRALCGCEKVAAEMSSGFDSTVVCCLAANELKKSGRRLQAYISAPEDCSGLLPGSPHHLLDEYPLAKVVADYNGNIDLQKVGQGHGNAWRDIAASLAWLEMPVYNFCNLGWIMNLRTQALRGGAQVLLNAGMGNMVISCGSYSRSLNQILNERRYLTAAGLVVDRFLQKPAGYRSLRAAAGALYRRWFPAAIPAGDQSPLWRDLTGSARRFAELDRLTAAFDDYLRLFVHSSVYGLKNSGIAQMAELGAIVRDPLRDRQVFEFARALPPEQYAKGYGDRALIRRAAKGLLPEEKRLSYTRGLQGTDWLKRLEPDWDKVLAEARAAAKNPLVQQLTDENELNKLFGSSTKLDVAYYQNRLPGECLQLIALVRFTENDWLTVNYGV